MMPGLRPTVIAPLNGVDIAGRTVVGIPTGRGTPKPSVGVTPPVPVNGDSVRRAHVDAAADVVTHLQDSAGLVGTAERGGERATHDVTVSNFHVKIDGCVGQSFIRSYAVLTRQTDQSDAVLSYVGVAKAV